MGDWNISIQGVGAHHNDSPSDADQLAAKFVKELKDAGQSVTAATLTSGSKTELNIEGENHGA